MNLPAASSSAAASSLATSSLAASTLTRTSLWTLTLGTLALSFLLQCGFGLYNILRFNVVVNTSHLLTSTKGALTSMQSDSVSFAELHTLWWRSFASTDNTLTGTSSATSSLAGTSLGALSLW